MKQFGTLYIDCEWDGWSNDPSSITRLLSIALVSTDGEEFYMEHEYNYEDLQSQWVKDNVHPFLTSSKHTYSVIQHSMAAFLSQWKHVTIIADWPEDIERFCRLCILSPGVRISMPMTSFEILQNVSYESELPHHALHDARALMKANMQQ